MLCPGGVARYVLLDLPDRLVALEIQHLSHGCSHTSRHGTSKCEVHRTLIVVGCALAPFCGHHRLDGRMGRYLFSDGFGSFLQVCDVVGISVKPCAHVVGNGLVVELPLVSVAQDGLNLVVGRNEDITLVEAPVEGVVLHLTCSSGLLAWCQFETTCNR